MLKRRKKKMKKKQRSWNRSLLPRRVGLITDIELNWIEECVQRIIVHEICDLKTQIEIPFILNNKCLEIKYIAILLWRTGEIEAASLMP